ncbi:hypothetical protein ABIF41_002208 [Bradyrhizobium japonicum]
MAGCPGRSTALAMIVAAASAWRGHCRQHRHGVGNAERKAAAVAPAGRDPPHGIISIDLHSPHHAVAIGPVHQADRKMFASRKMQRDVAAIVDIGLVERRRVQHCAQNLLGHAARHRGHRRDEAIGGIGRNGGIHAARNGALQWARSGFRCLAQLRQLHAELIEQPGEAARCGVIGRTHLARPPPRFDDQINRPILQMQPPTIRQQCDLREPCHARGPGIGFCQGNWRTSSPFCTSESGLT